MGRNSQPTVQHLGCRDAALQWHGQDYTICCQQALWSSSFTVAPLSAVSVCPYSPSLRPTREMLEWFLQPALGETNDFAFPRLSQCTHQGTKLLFVTFQQSPNSHDNQRKKWLKFPPFNSCSLSFSSPLLIPGTSWALKKLNQLLPNAIIFFVVKVPISPAEIIPAASKLA